MGSRFWLFIIFYLISLISWYPTYITMAKWLISVSSFIEHWKFFFQRCKFARSQKRFDKMWGSYSYKVFFIWKKSVCRYKFGYMFWSAYSFRIFYFLCFLFLRPTFPFKAETKKRNKEGKAVKRFSIAYSKSTKKFVAKKIKVEKSYDFLKEIGVKSYYRAIDRDKMDKDLRQSRKRSLFVAPCDRPSRDIIIKKLIEYSRFWFCYFFYYLILHLQSF